MLVEKNYNGLIFNEIKLKKVLVPSLHHSYGSVIFNTFNCVKNSTRVPLFSSNFETASDRYPRCIFKNDKIYQKFQIICQNISKYDENMTICLKIGKYAKI